jgi:hypothetical protein
VLKKNVELIQKKQTDISIGYGTDGSGLKNSDVLMDIRFF